MPSLMLTNLITIIAERRHKNATQIIKKSNKDAFTVKHLHTMLKIQHLLKKAYKTT
jgi:hypothetical protein